MTSKNLVAIDIAKDSLAVQTESSSGSFAYDRPGLQKLLGKIQSLKHPMVICEATGGYERMLLEELFERSIPVALVNPARVRAFAKSEGIKAKTDPIDAAMLLRYARSKELQPTQAPPKNRQELQALMDRRSQLSESLAREKNRLQKSPRRIAKSIEKMIRILEKEIQAIEKEIEELVGNNEQMADQSAKMQSVCGVGAATSWSILAYLGEITELKRNQIVALAGIAPFNRDSGKFKGKRKIEGGRAKLRKCLYMAAQSAAVHNPHIKAYVDGLRARGKPYKCAMVAAMRKLLLHLQSLLKNPQKALA